MPVSGGTRATLDPPKLPRLPPNLFPGVPGHAIIGPMLAKLNTFALLGIDAVPVEVEVDASAGLPKTVLVGLPELAVKESIHRIERALANLGYDRPSGRTVINLAPADLKKDASAFDLPIAMGLLAATGQLLPEQVKEFGIVGELALDGSIRPVKGALSIAMTAVQRGVTRLLVPTTNAKEAAVVDGVEVYAVDGLAQAVGILSGQLQLEPIACDLDALFSRLGSYDVDFADVRGQEFAKRALVVAAAGSHNLIMIGSPGTGKSMLAQRLPTILPPLTLPESLETTRIYSALGRLKPDQPLLATRPFRSPHHTISDAGMAGGGSIPTPGEISLAHHGVLFLDELPEFSRGSLEVLRQPLETGNVTISRALNSTTFPASFMLVAAMNPTPKGDMPAGEVGRRAMEQYLSRLSGPLLDRIDVHVEAPAVSWNELSKAPVGTSSATMRQRVLAARLRQLERQGVPNSRLSGKQLDSLAVLDDQSRSMVGNAMTELGLSARAYDKIRRVSRTIADLENNDAIQPQHVAEAIGYRLLDRRI